MRTSYNNGTGRPAPLERTVKHNQVAPEDKAFLNRGHCAVPAAGPMSPSLLPSPDYVVVSGVSSQVSFPVIKAATPLQSR